MELRESTLTVVTFGPFVSQTDGFTAKTALTPTIRISKNGATAIARNSGTAVAHDENGHYRITLDSTDTNTLGRLRMMATDAANHLPVWQDLLVIAAGYYDEKYGASKALTAASANTATLDAGASAVDNYYINQLLTLTSGTGAGQTLRITGYVGSTKVATLANNWATNPVAGTTFRIVANGTAVLTATERDAISDSLLDRSNGVETGLTPRAALKIISAATAGKVSGASAGPGTVTIRNAQADNKNRIIATNDIFGNRTSVTLDVT